MSAELVLTGLEAPEGPVLLAPGDVAFVEQVRGQVSRCTDGEYGTISRGPGAPNSIVLGSDGCLYAAQNGGVVNAWRAEVPTMPALERITMAGEIETLTTAAGGRALLAPNDLAFGPDGLLYLTDPGEAYDPLHPAIESRIVAFGPTGSETVATPGLVYSNGLAFLPSNALVWVESYTRRVRVLQGDAIVTLCSLPDRHVPDGVAVAADGRLFIASVSSHGISVVSPHGEYLGLLTLDERANPTNCCFDGSALWVTDFTEGWEPGGGNGRLWRVDTDALPAPISAGSLP